MEERLIALREQKASPIQSIKDMSQFRCVHPLGGYWADLDFLYLGGEQVLIADPSVVLLTEHERTYGAFKKGWRKRSQLQGLPVSVNIGFMWGVVRAACSAKGCEGM